MENISKQDSESTKPKYVDTPAKVDNVVVETTEPVGREVKKDPTDGVTVAQAPAPSVPEKGVNSAAQPGAAPTRGEAPTPDPTDAKPASGVKSPAE
jgi:hypothetical protein